MICIIDMQHNITYDPDHDYGYVCSVSLILEKWSWFRTPGSVPILGLANAPIVETEFLELAMSLLDFSPRIPLGTFSILLQEHDTHLGLGQHLWEIFWKSNATVIWPGQGLWSCVQCGLNLGDMTLLQDHYTSLGTWQQLCKILFTSKMTVVSYGLDKDYGDVCSMTLNLEI